METRPPLAKTCRASARTRPPADDDNAERARAGAATGEHVTVMIIGALIIIFLIAEPHGLARLWQIGKQKLRVWPFPY